MVSLAVPNLEQRSMVAENSEKLSQLTSLMQTNSMFSLRRRGRENDQTQESELPKYELENLKLPILVFHGNADINVPVSHAEFITSRVPHAEIKIFEGGDHFFYLPFREEFVEILASFLRRNSSRLSDKILQGRKDDF